MWVKVSLGQYVLATSRYIIQILNCLSAHCLVGLNHEQSPQTDSFVKLTVLQVQYGRLICISFVFHRATIICMVILDWII